MSADDIVEAERRRAENRRHVRRLAAIQKTGVTDCHCPACLMSRAILQYVPDDDAVPE